MPEVVRELSFISVSRQRTDKDFEVSLVSHGVSNITIIEVLLIGVGLSVALLVV